MIGTLNSAAMERIDRSTKIRSAWTSSGDDTKMSILLILSVSAMPHMFRTDSARASLADRVCPQPLGFGPRMRQAGYSRHPTEVEGNLIRDAEAKARHDRFTRNPKIALVRFSLYCCFASGQSVLKLFSPSWSILNVADFAPSRPVTRRM